MSFLKLFSNDAVKKTILKSFAKHCKEQGINKILVNVSDQNDITFEPLNDELMLVEKKDYEFYREYFLQNQKNLGYGK